MSEMTSNSPCYSEYEIGLLLVNGQYGELLKEVRIDPNRIFDHSGNSLLHLAVKHDSVYCTNFLIKSGCNVNIQNKLGNTALMDAISQGKFLLARALLKANSNIRLANVNGDNALKLSLKISHNPTAFTIMKYILEQVKLNAANNEEIVEQLREANCSLTCAVYSNDIEVVRLMLQQGLDINGLYSGLTALHVAAMKKNDEMIRLLVQNGCNVNIDEASGYLPLDFMLEHKTIQCPEIMSSLMPPADNIDWTSCRRDFGGLMKLHHIFAMGTKKTLQLFLQSYKINLTARDRNGQTPLHYLTRNCNSRIFELFENFDFDIDAYDERFSRTALHLAANQGNVEAVRFLLDKGADGNATDLNGCTPIFYTITRSTRRDVEFRECIKLLVQHGVDLQVVLSEEDTIFRRASWWQNYFLIEPVLAHLAIIEIKGESIKKLILDQIDSDICLRSYYQSCKQELTKMKTMTVYGNVTLLKFLTERVTKVALYTREKVSFDRIMYENIVSDSYYSCWLRKRFDRAMKIDKLRTTATLVINESIRQLECNHIIVNGIVEFLSYRDLLTFD